MTAEAAAQPVRQVRAQDDGPDMVRYWVLVAAVAHLVLRDRRFHVAMIAGAIGVVALAELLKNNQARPPGTRSTASGRSWPAPARPWSRASTARRSRARPAVAPEPPSGQGSSRRNRAPAHRRLPYVLPGQRAR